MSLLHSHPRSFDQVLVALVGEDHELSGSHGLKARLEWAKN